MSSCQGPCGSIRSGTRHTCQFGSVRSQNAFFLQDLEEATQKTVMLFNHSQLRRQRDHRHALVQAYFPAELAQDFYDIGRTHLVDFGHELVVHVEAMLSNQLTSHRVHPRGDLRRRGYGVRGRCPCTLSAQRFSLPLDFVEPVIDMSSRGA